MKAVITGESECVGVKVQDNNGVDHGIEMEFDGTIKHHQQNAYSNKAAERNDIDNEHVNQARRFARFYVHHQRGYDTLEPRRNPDRIAAATLAVGSLSPETLLEYLGDFYQQLNHYRSGSEPLVETPEISPTALIWLKQDLTVNLDADATAALTEALTTHGVLDALENALPGDSDLQTAIQEALADHDIDTTAVGDAIGQSLLGDTGPLEISWREAGQTSSMTVDGTGTPLGDRADVRLQMFSDMYEFNDPEGFQQSVVHHLRCQIRDCYIRMGIAPPEDVRIQGPGFYENVSWYEHLGFYEPYNDPRQEVTDWLVDDTPEELLV